MGKQQILYLDGVKDRALYRALTRYGAVVHAGDINQALFRMAEQDFHYYFIDADLPQALALLKHLRHDPQLMPPVGVILITGNREEDCDAWSVDTFINRNTAPDELPYVFSHLRCDVQEPSNVLRLAEYEQCVDEDPARQSAPDPQVPDGPSDGMDPREFFGRSVGRRERRDVTYDEKKSSGNGSPPVGPDDAEATPSRAPGLAMKVIVLVLLISCVGFWAFAWGPLKKQPVRKQDSAGRKEVKADSSNDGGTFFSVPTGYTSQTGPVAVQTGVPPAAPSEGEPVGSDPAQNPDAGQQAQEQETSPSPPPANQPPSVSISGPTQVVHGETATYTASASDPDGDSVSLSWTTRSMCWSTPGLYSISVSATDSRGACSSDQVSVRVI